MGLWEYVKAKRILEELLTDEPGHGYAHYLMSVIYWYMMSDGERALYHGRLALKYSPNNSEIQRYYVTLLNDNGQETNAISRNMQMLESAAAGLEWLYFEMGRSFELQLKFEKAKLYYKKAILCTTDGSFISECERAHRRVKKKQKMSRTKTKKKAAPVVQAKPKPKKSWLQKAFGWLL